MKACKNWGGGWGKRQMEGTIYMLALLEKHLSNYGIISIV